MKKDNKIIVESIEDLKADFEELDYLCSSLHKSLENFKNELKKLKKFTPKNTSEIVQKDLNYYSSRFFIYQKHIKNLSLALKIQKPTQSLVEKATCEKEKYFDLVRTQTGIISSLLTCLDWQSPSFFHSTYSLSGRQIGKIKGTINDYKRDWHLDARNYEKKYLKEYIDAPNKLKLGCLMTTSGMAAFTTILNYLLMEAKVDGKVLMGKSSYFQYKLILAKILKDNLIEIDEMDTKSTCKLIKKELPSVIFLDSMCNAKNIPIADIEKILDFWNKHSKKKVYLVIDNSCLSISFQPFSKNLKKYKKITIITFESLMKYIHFGMDRSTGGIITGYTKDIQALFEARKHLGTNIADASVYTFPLPNRKLLQKRLQRFERNALLFTKQLEEYLKNNKTKMAQIVYPGLKSYSDYKRVKRMPFKGSFFQIEFKKKSIRGYQRFIKLVIKEAKKKKVNMVGATSFGLQSTRIYLTSLWNDWGEPFVRVSVGTENRWQMEKIIEVFRSSIKKFSKWKL